MKRIHGVNGRHEAGFTLISLVVILFLIGFFTLLILKIGPIYLNHFKVKTALTSLEKEPLITKSKQEILALFGKRLDINNVDYVSAREDVELLKRPEFVTMTIDYEVVEPIVGNLQVLVYFTEEITVK